MAKRPNFTCDDCYFRRHDLCAIPGNTPCPTFRAAKEGRLLPPRQLQLIARPPAGAPAPAAA